MRPLQTHTGYWVRCVSNEFSQALGRRLEEKGVTLAEWILLRELYDGDRRPSALADRLGLTRGAISKLAERLVTKLMITQESVGDRRGQMLALTGGGRAMVIVMGVLIEQVDEEFFGGLDSDTRARLTAALRNIALRRGARAAPED